MQQRQLEQQQVGQRRLGQHMLNHDRHILIRRMGELQHSLIRHMGGLGGEQQLQELQWRLGEISSFFLLGQRLLLQQQGVQPRQQVLKEFFQLVLVLHHRKLGRELEHFKNWCNWELVFMDRLCKLCYWGDGQVGSLNTESKTISNVVDSLDDSVGVGVAIRSSYSTIGVSGFLFGRVQVSITISKVSEFILRLELAGLGKGWYSNYSSGG